MLACNAELSARCMVDVESRGFVSRLSSYHVLESIGSKVLKDVRELAISSLVDKGVMYPI
jgi:hypothetical protein